MRIPPSIIRYWLAMNASAFAAAVHSSVAFFGVAGVHAVSDSIPALNLQQFAAVFLITFGRAILKYLDEHPLTDLVAAEVTRLKLNPPEVPGRGSASESLLTSPATEGKTNL